MSKPNPTDRYYSKDHEWIKDTGDGAVIVGITDYAQAMLTDIVFVELPAKGKQLSQGDPMAVVESVKSVSDVYAPVGGDIIDVNGKLEEDPSIINTDAFDAGWIVKIRMQDPGQLTGLLSAAEYDKLVVEEKH